MWKLVLKGALKEMMFIIFWVVLVVVIVLMLTSCGIPTRDEIREDCKEQVDKALAKVDEVLAECKMRADEAAQLCTTEIETVIDDFQEWVEAKIEEVKVEAENEILTRFGCKKQLPTITNPTGWNCSSTWVCK